MGQTAWRALAGLVEAGKVEAVGETKGRRYRLAAPKVAAPPAGADDPRWAKVLEIARREGKVTRARVVEVLGVSESTAGRALHDLAERGRIGGAGRGRGVVYHATCASP